MAASPAYNCTDSTSMRRKRSPINIQTREKAVDLRSFLNGMVAREMPKSCICQWMMA